MSKQKEKVTNVNDGDTFSTKSRPKHSVRLAGVDAPEKGQRGSKAATKALRQMIGGKKVEVKTVARDKYGRAVANVEVDGKSVNRAMNKKLKK